MELGVGTLRRGVGGWWGKEGGPCSVARLSLAGGRLGADTAAVLSGPEEWRRRRQSSRDSGSRGTSSPTPGQVQSSLAAAGGCGS